MKGKFMIIAALLGALTFGACVDSEESASVTAVRNAKAEQLKSVATLNNAKAQAEATIAAAEAQIASAQAALLQAQATKAAAEAAAQNAATEAQKIENQMAAIEAEKAAARAEAEIARIEAKLELDLLKYQTDLLNAQLTFNQAMQDLADDERENLEYIYSQYNAALDEVATIMTEIALNDAAIAELEADIAELDADKNWDAVVKAANDAAAAAQKKVTETESKLAAKKAAYEKIESMGGINYAELKKEIEAATKALAAANKNLAYATKNEDTKDEAYQENSSDIATSEYEVLLAAYEDALLANFAYGLVDTDEDGTADAIGFARAEINEDGEWESEADNDIVVLRSDVATTDFILDEDGDDCCEYFTSFDALNEEALELLIEDGAKILSTSPEATNLEIAQKTLAAWEKATEFEDLVNIYEAYLEKKAAILAKISEAATKIAVNERMIEIYEATDFAGTDEEYEEAVEDLEDEIDDLEDDIDGFEDDLEELEEDLEDDLEDMYAEDEAEVLDAIDEYLELVEAVEDAQEAYNDVADEEAFKALMWGFISGAYEKHAALVANDVVVAQAYHDAHVAYEEAYEAYEEADEYLDELNDLWDELAAAPEGSVEDLMNEELQALAAEIATLEATLKTQKSDLDAAQKKAAKIAAMTEEEIAEYKEEYLEDAIEELEELIDELEEENELLEQELTVATIDVENWTEILEDALGEDEE